MAKNYDLTIIKTNSSEESVKCQEKLFREGYTWSDGTSKIISSAMHLFVEYEYTKHTKVVLRRWSSGKPFTDADYEWEENIRDSYKTYKKITAKEFLGHNKVLVLW